MPRSLLFLFTILLKEVHIGNMHWSCRTCSCEMGNKGPGICQKQHGCIARKHLIDCFQSKGFIPSKIRSHCHADIEWKGIVILTSFNSQLSENSVILRIRCIWSRKRYLDGCIQGFVHMLCIIIFVNHKMRFQHNWIRKLKGTLIIIIQKEPSSYAARYWISSSLDT